MSAPSPETPADAAVAEVLFLGTYHFANPGLDVVKAEVDDVLAPGRQAEIEAVVHGLAGFRPTRIAVEARPDAADGRTRSTPPIGTERGRWRAASTSRSGSGWRRGSAPARAPH